MAIQEDGNLFYIHGKSMSMILENDRGYLLLRHLGAKILSYHHANGMLEKDHAFSGNPQADNRCFSLDTQRQLVGSYGVGDFREPSFIVQHGNNEVCDFRFVSSCIIEGVVDAKGLPTPYVKNQEAQTLILHLADEVAALALDVYITTYEGLDTFSIHTCLSNQGDEKVTIHQAIGTIFDLATRSYDVMSFQGAYGREKDLHRQSVTQGLFEMSSQRGASGHAQTPSLIVCDEKATDDAGEAWAFQLMYSGNFKAFVQKNQLGEVRLGMGLNDKHFTWPLEKNEEFHTPVTLVTYSKQGLNHLTQESQTFVRKHILPETFAGKERPILINNWEATYFDFQKEKLLELADEASRAGMELFVLDDGWFGNRWDDNRALGDWKVNEEKLGGSLADLIKEVHDRQLKFGIWVEPEMVSEDSDLYRAHPDWCIQAPNRPHTYSRNQLVLNLAHPEVVAYLKEIFHQLLSQHEIDYVKWDMNRNITNLGNGSSYIETMMQSHGYMLGLYDVLADLTAHHPTVLFESCSGGGGRNDLGMMRYFSQVWASDNTDAIARLAIQEGSSYLYPSISMGAHVSAVPNHQTGRVTPLETRGHVAMMGNLGYELDLTQLSREEKEEIKEQVALYKQIRPLVQFGKQYRLLSPKEGKGDAAVQFSDGNQVLVTYVRVLSQVEITEPIVYLKDLEEEALYHLVGTDLLYSGAELMYAGLTVDLPQKDYVSQQFYFVKK